MAVRWEVTLAQQPRWRPVAVVLAGVVVLLGCEFLSAHAPVWRPIVSLDREFDLVPDPGQMVSVNIPALVSAGILAFAGMLWWRASGVGSVACERVLGAGLAFMAADELLSLHERIEGASGVDWQLLYLPVMAALGVGMLMVLGRHWRAGHREVVALLFLGGALWAGSQLLEFLQWDGDTPRPGYHVMMRTEEIAEFLGSGVFALAALAAIRRKVASPDSEHAT